MLLAAIELRHAPFILWIHDLSALDPYYVLPILMTCTMVLQTRMNPTPPDPVQAKVMQFMPFIFMFVVPAITMRLLAEEKGSGTIELLITMPVRDWEVVVGKWLAAMALQRERPLPSIAEDVEEDAQRVERRGLRRRGFSGSLLLALFEDERIALAGDFA